MSLSSPMMKSGCSFLSLSRSAWRSLSCLVSSSICFFNSAIYSAKVFNLGAATGGAWAGLVAAAPFLAASVEAAVLAVVEGLAFAAAVGLAVAAAMGLAAVAVTGLALAAAVGLAGAEAVGLVLAAATGLAVGYGAGEVVF